MIKKIIIFMALLMVMTISSASANDGGPYPDYNEYITYSVKTDCKEIGIGEELTFTVTLTNHTSAPFGIFHPTHFFKNAYIDWSREEYRYFSDLYLDAYKTNTYELTCKVPINVEWYKKGDDYYIDLCPGFLYMLPIELWNEYEKYDLPYDEFMSMTGPEPVSIKLTNIKDGSELIRAEVLNKDNCFVYYDISQTDSAESRSYIGEYCASLNEYISIENISDETMKMVYINDVIDVYREIDESFDLYSKESIVAEIGTGKWDLPDDIVSFETTENRILFQDETGQYYGVFTTSQYQTKVHERLYLRVETECIESIVDEYNLFSVSIINDSDEDINNFFVCFTNAFPETKQELYNNTIKVNLKAGEIFTLPESVKLDYDWRSVFCLRVGCWENEILDYWKVYLNNYDDIFEIDKYGIHYHVELYPLLNDIEIFDLDARLNPQVKPTPTTEPTKEPTETIEKYTTYIPEAVLKDEKYFFNTPTPTEEITVEMVDSYYIPPLVFIALGAVGIIAIVLIIVLRKKEKRRSE